MSFTVRNLMEEDYETLSKWWVFWWKKPVERKMLPDNLSDGIMIECNGVPVSAGFLYATSSSYLFWLEFIISSPSFKGKELREIALDHTVQVLLKLAKKAGAISVFSSIKHQSLINCYLRNGFIPGDKNMTNFHINL